MDVVRDSHRITSLNNGIAPPEQEAYSESRWTPLPIPYDPNDALRIEDSAGVTGLPQQIPRTPEMQAHYFLDDQWWFDDDYTFNIMEDNLPF